MLLHALIPHLSLLTDCNKDSPCPAQTHTYAHTHLHTYSHRKSRLTSHPLIHLPAGALSIFKPLDREEQDIFNLTIIAEDHGIPQHSSSQLLCVHVIDVNDEVPWFEENSYEAQISENKPGGTSVLTVSASDLDQGETASRGKVSRSCRLACVRHRGAWLCACVRALAIQQIKMPATLLSLYLLSKYSN